MKRYLLMKRHLLLLGLLLGSSVGTPAFAGTTTYGQHYSSSVQSSPSNPTGAGTTLGGLGTLATPGTAAAKFPFALNAIVTGLTIGTVYWIDISCTAVTGGTATP